MLYSWPSEERTWGRHAAAAGPKTRGNCCSIPLRFEQRLVHSPVLICFDEWLHLTAPMEQAGTLSFYKDDNLDSLWKAEHVHIQTVHEVHGKLTHK